MDWTEKCNDCAKQGELINYSVVEGQMVIDYLVEVEQYEQAIFEINVE